MRLTRTLLSTSLLAASMLAVTVQAAPIPTLDTYVLGALKKTTTAKYKGGATLNGGASFLKSVPADAPINIMGSLTVHPADVGLDGDLFMVFGIGPVMYMRTPTGVAVWNFNGVDMTGLVPYASKTLGTTETYSYSDLETQLGISLDGKTVYGYLGYMSDISKLNYSTAIKFSVDTLPSSETCPVGPASIPGFPGRGKRLCVLTGTITTPKHLTANFEYIMEGTVFIGGDNVNSTTLTIDPGVSIFGQSGPEALVINRGSQLFVNGTPEKPVIMTAAIDAEGDANSTTRGQWGGLVINGNAPINGCVVGTVLCEAQGEGATGLYGGNNPADSSGVITYLQVKYAGYEITPEDELNGIGFQGVGNGTLLDYIQVHNNFDDGIEFFGGTANAKHVYLSGNGDDNVDWTFGWTGKLQHVVVVQTDRGDQGIEADNNASGLDSLPRSHPHISNITLIGNSNTDTGILLREGTAGNISNAVVTGFADDCIDIDHTPTFVNAGSSATSLTGELTMTNSVVNCSVNFREEAGDLFTVQAWFTNQAGNSTTNVGMTSYINTPAVNALTPATQTDSWFDATDYVGAVKNVASDWTAGWTYKD